jgi:hypothetical protein
MHRALQALGPLVALLGVALAASPALAATYYVDSQSGNDSYPGTTLLRPWQTLGRVNAHTFLPGDRILLRAGGQWPAAGDTASQLRPRGSGSPGAVIAIDRYGSGDKPKIVGGGVGERCYELGRVEGAVHLQNQSYWEIRNLDVSNHGTPGCEHVGILALNDQSPAVVTRHIVIADNVVHDVNGMATGYYGANAGIAVTADMNTANPCPTWPNPCPANPVWNDVTIENNSIYAVDRIGIFVGPEWQAAGMEKRDLPLFPRRMGSTEPGVPSGITIRGNALSDVGGDGILTFIAANVTIDGNVVSGSGTRVIAASCGARCPRNWSGYATCNSAAIWTAVTDNSVIQYNEVYDYALPDASGRVQCDGTAFNADFATTSQVVQYNYSHHNQGGMYMTCEVDGTPASPIALDNLRVRYNVSYDDVGGAFTHACGVGFFPAGGDSLDINNNLVIVPVGRNMPIFGGSISVPGTAYIYNNIFYVLGTTSYAQTPGAIFDFNVYYAPNYPGGSRPANEPVDNHAQTGNPLLMIAPAATAPVGRDNLFGLRLREDSPALGSAYQPGYGIDGHPNLGWVDFWGNATGLDGAPNRGPYNGDGEAYTTCANGLDDDGDSLVDAGNDPGCRDPSASSTENPRCQDGLDNDGDGGFDFDGGVAATGGGPLGPIDPQCGYPYLNRETPASCGLGGELALLLWVLLFGRSRSRRSTQALP